MAEPVLSLKDLTVEFDTEDGIVKAVTDVSYDLYPGEVLGVVGESGSGKSVSVMSVLGLIPAGRVVKGEAIYKGRDLLKLSQKELRKIRGGELAMIFQDPMTSLNPVLTIGDQIGEAVKVHNPGKDDEATRKRVVELLELVGVPFAERRVDQYPHEFSGGMRQRAMIAMAIANDPAVLDRGRADHGARRDDPGADRGGAEGGARGDAGGDHPDHARPRPDRGARRPRRRHVRGQRRRALRRLHDLQRAAAPVHAGPAEQPGPRRHRPGVAAPDSRSAAEPRLAAARLPLPPALRVLARPGRLPHRLPGAAARSARAETTSPGVTSPRSSRPPTQRRSWTPGGRS